MKAILLIVFMAELAFARLVLIALARSLAAMFKRFCTGRNRQNG